MLVPAVIEVDPRDRGSQLPPMIPVQFNPPEYTIGKAAQIAEIDLKLGAVTPYLPRLFLLEMEHQRALLHAEWQWLGGVISDLQSGALYWDEEWQAAQTADVSPAR